MLPGGREMEIFTIVMLGILLALTLWINFRKSSGEGHSYILFQNQIESLRQQMSESINTNTSQVNQQLAQVTQQINMQLNSMSQNLQTTSGHIGSRLDNATKVIGEVKQNLGEVSKATEKIWEVGKDISNLQEILRAPKLRGVLGELFLGDLLA